MDDITLVAKLVDGTTLYVSPLHDQTYSEYVEADNLGGSAGYFIARERLNQFEILAKAASLDAAREIFGMLTASRLAAS
ncbi:hypothetical protein BV509_20565 [Rhodovulum sulfidophilum]|uniref:KTSC domain-containing protein n=1 Tax=Rhodovulum visakhapatnamense TaxID=364297 RepID=A0ABS1RLQ1_9RHOB|nr:hypothetical protein [Rhodovulum visakhapatnamense]MBL3571808.1 hypothetical protein [Rhodovulum visakhapatnamense]MBL3580429.1 hypothetical protein [Rhodovulum visakhapatnamense]OLS46509.1 hypothetical protein BV509_20565 [Rhodovulum sulfidophilum]